MATITAEQLSELLISKGYSHAVVSAFKENEICGRVFSEMDDQHFKELAPKIADRVNLKKLRDSDFLQNKVKHKHS